LRERGLRRAQQHDGENGPEKISHVHDDLPQALFSRSLRRRLNLRLHAFKNRSFALFAFLAGGRLWQHPAPNTVMRGHPGPASGRPECKLVPRIHVFADEQDVDGRDEPGHDESFRMEFLP
jgi:hypothetical protein